MLRMTSESQVDTSIRKMTREADSMTSGSTMYQAAQVEAFWSRCAALLVL
jgi:hypothetical protein